VCRGKPPARNSRLITTNETGTPLQFDQAETIFDWRTILKYRDLPVRIRDYGAGCSRQCMSAFLRHPRNIYTAVGSTLAAYTVQSLVISGTLRRSSRSSDRQHQDLAVGRPGCAGISLPCPGLARAKATSRALTRLILACHAHNELSGSDFRRLIAAVDKMPCR
jgi:hypothetical protein